MVKKRTSSSRSQLVQVLVCWYLLVNPINGQILVPLKSKVEECKDGVESFEKVGGITVRSEDRIPLYSSTSGAITADCYNRCRSSSSCTGFWINYPENACFRLTSAKSSAPTSDIDLTKPNVFFQRMCLQGNVCNKAWVTERIPSHELAGHDDVIIRSVESRQKCAELCLTDAKLPCRSADYWEVRKECRLSREDRRTKPGSFVQSTSGVHYLENSCIQPLSNKERHCEWDVMKGLEFQIIDFITKANDFEACQKTCEEYAAFTCRSVTYDTIASLCMLSGSDVITTSPKLLTQRSNKIFAQRIPCLDMSLECRGESMVMKLKTHSPFYGKMYSSILSKDCETFGKGEQLTILRYPLDGCGVRKESDGSFSATLIVQQHPLIQKLGDAAFKLVCNFPAKNRTIQHNLSFRNAESESRLVLKGSESFLRPILGITSSIINASASTPKVQLRIVDTLGKEVTGVELGDEVHLKIELNPKSAYGIFASRLIATSGTNEETLMLIDERGCPVDSAIFPQLKYAGDGTKSLQQRFEAFKFTNDAVVRFQVDIRFCRYECPPIDCDGESSYGRKKRSTAPLNETIPENEIMKLHKDIIVSNPSVPESKPRVFAKREHNDEVTFETAHSELCASKVTVIYSIIAISILQVLIVIFCAVCIMVQRRQGKSFLVSSKPQYLNPLNRSASISQLYYGPPSIRNTPVE